MKLYIDLHDDDYDLLQDPYYLAKINEILQNFIIMERLDEDFDAMSHPDFPTIREFFRMCAGRQRPTLRPAAPLAVASCPVM